MAGRQPARADAGREAQLPHVRLAEVHAHLAARHALHGPHDVLLDALRQPAVSGPQFAVVGVEGDQRAADVRSDGHCGVPVRDDGGRGQVDGGGARGGECRVSFKQVHYMGRSDGTSMCWC